MKSLKNEGDTVLSGEVLGHLGEGGAVAAPAPVAVAAASPAPAATAEAAIFPAARKLAEEGGIDPASITGTGKGGRVTKEDAVAAVEAKKSAPAAAPKPVTPAAEAPLFAAGDVEKRVPMTRLRAKVAERPVEAQSSMAMLTTFNEVDADRKSWHCARSTKTCSRRPITVFVWASCVLFPEKYQINNFQTSVCTNPLTWQLNEDYAPKKLNKGG